MRLEGIWKMKRMGLLCIINNNFACLDSLSHAHDLHPLTFCCLKCLSLPLACSRPPFLSATCYLRTRTLLYILSIYDTNPLLLHHYSFLLTNPTRFSLSRLVLCYTLITLVANLIDSL